MRYHQTHETFLYQQGRKWLWVCVTCQQYGKQYGKQRAINECLSYHKNVIIYDRALRAIITIQDDPTLF